MQGKYRRQDDYQVFGLSNLEEGDGKDCGGSRLGRPAQSSVLDVLISPPNIPVETLSGQFEETALEFRGKAWA